jgi:hypothetical protein
VRGGGGAGHGHGAYGGIGDLTDGGRGRGEIVRGGMDGDKMVGTAGDNKVGTQINPPTAPSSPWFPARPDEA